MSIHINRFIDLIKAQESRNARDVTLTLREAKDLHGDITKLLLTIETLRESNTNDQEPIIVEITGGSFKN